MRKPFSRCGSHNTQAETCPKCGRIKRITCLTCGHTTEKRCGCPPRHNYPAPRTVRLGYPW